MRSKTLPIALLVIFLVSLFPTALAQEETDTEVAEFTELETESESELRTVDSADCWSDKPDYTPGIDKGFFIWQGTCGQFWWIDWSGDTREKWKRWYRIVHKTEPATEEPTAEEVLTLENQATTLDTNTLITEEVTELQSTGDITSTSGATGNTEATGAQIATNLRERIKATVSNTENTATAAKAITAAKKWLVKKPKLMYRVKGTITSNGQIYDVGIRKFDRRDKIVFRPYKNTITFHGWVGPHFDGIFFRTTGDQVTFDLEFDGEKSTEVVYVGKDKKNPETNPFTLTGEPAIKKACPVGNIIYNKKCVSQVAGIAITPNGLAGDLSEKEVPTEKRTIKPSEPRPTVLASTARQAIAEKLREKLRERIANLPEPAKQKLEALNEKRIETLAKIEELKENPELIKFKRELNFKVRELNTERIKEAVKNYGLAKQDFEKVRERAKEINTEFLKAKQDFKRCTENCEEKEAKVLEQAKSFLTNTADSIIKHLEKIRNRVESSEDLTEEEATEIITKIDAQIKELEDAKAKAEAATTKDELKEATKTIRDDWKKIRNHADWYVGKLALAKHGGVIVKLKHLELRLQKVLERMEENGKDTSTIQPLVDEFNTHVEEAKKNFELATAKFLEFRNLPEPKGEAGNKLIQEAQGYMKKSKEHLGLAQQKLKEIVKAVKEAKGEEELATTTTEEALEETEADTETGAQ
ncbi:MAG: hypothetical protein Q8N77_04550 [Nanoarchaeota archaeon]|nr:hypothetical protein [Nanoarchaeota archaeon]